MSTPIHEKQWPAKEIVEDFSELRIKSPLTHVITNIVVTNWTANILLAAGASPAMVIAEEEVADFAAIASGLLINVGTLTSSDVKAMRAAAVAAQKAGTPWVIDPVAAGALRFRTDFAKELLDYKPSVIRGNASEILALGGAIGGGKGVDSTARSSEAISAAKELAIRTGAVVAVSGETDYITDGKDIVGVPGGHPLMTRVTGVGCSLGALMASFLGIQKDPLRAAVSASAVFAIAGFRAGQQSKGTGSFATAFLDQLTLLSEENA
ncbi:hydroxyethylthiazole kinase [Leptospira gomenensis]|uniref:Hydroxyethylthiazole kinase n=1 Tax=Leptospira gomenensis TaxID=2484974 RepID=A0A5F1Y735_9LEPT|nr:hydroxyethylthiazole kinase [Leptospira gomenensis]TGK29446.1 hydroxyethylthiazole kinase [Leptospira gomenensis]TGK33651.1 hydroxyethylthiazole kinase [Leptospira gomenensis]TGK44892.1 hydroxyethylthiazole kinase [Leptospira gomenensis]TGK64513.1 hydroxyethylthiazole kinase [Leptospira gomenensis]